MTTLLYILMLVHTCTSYGYASTAKSHYGTEFYLGMIAALASWRVDFQIDIASERNGSVHLNIPYLNIDSNKTIQKGSNSLTVSGTLIRVGNFTENRGIYLRTNVPVAVYVTWIPVYRSVMDSYLALPVSSLGNRYILASYDPYNPGTVHYQSEVIIIGVYDNTNVTIIDRYNHLSTLNLNRLNVHQIASSRDISNTVVESDKPVAVISGTPCALVPHNIYDCDLLLEQVIPTRAWSNTFIVPPVFPKTGFLLKVFSVGNETFCLKNTSRTVCKQSNHLSEEEYLMGTEPVVVTSNGPVSVVQYGVGQKYDNVAGDEFMTMVQGTANYLNQYYFVIPNIYYRQAATNYLCVVVPTANTGGLLLDGSPLAPSKQYSVPDPFSNYTVLIITVDLGFHVLNHTNGHVLFGASVYGLAEYIGYGFPVGFGIYSEEISTRAPTTSTSSTSSTAAITDISTTSKHFLTTGYAHNDTVNICYSCDDLSHVELCDTVKHCQNDEVCFIESYLKSGRTLFKSGCLPQKTCMKEVDAFKNMPDRCVECCAYSYCNHRGCGDSGLLPRNLRGPLCYDCPYEWSPDDCTKLTLCERDEFCSIEEFRWGTHSHFTMGCAHGKCISTQRSVHLTTRDLPICHSCCKDDYCNVNCTMHGHSGPIIVG